MLVVCRQEGEEVVMELGDGRTAVVRICGVRGEKVRIGFDVPKDLIVHRREVWEQVEREKQGAVDGEAKR